ncbi:MAG: flagellar hook protein FlgE [Myxococcota bacterium]
MSVLRSMHTGASGLRSHSSAIGVTGDNIANANTMGFKRSRGVFEDILGRSIAGSSATPMAGAGSRLAHIEQMWTQGALLTTDSPTDLALSGSGFFMVDGNVSGIDGRFFTRAGQFRIDAAGQLVNPNGLQLQGYTAAPDGTMGADLGALTVAGGTLPANATTAADMSLNLDANTPVATAAFDPAAPSGFPAPMTIYDSLGNSHEITVYFNKTGANQWEWHAMVDGGEVAGGTPGVPFEGASGTLDFNTDGALSAETPGASTWNFIDATPGQTIEFDFGDAIADGGTGFAATTQLGSPSTTNGLSQDGFGAGSVSGISIEPDGIVTGVFTNGQRRVLGQVAIADFASEHGLERAGSGLWVETAASGEALIGGAGSGGRGSIVAGALEGSNVDLGREFVDLISFQRGFQANSRIITTSDEMYGELVNLKR